MCGLIALITKNRSGFSSDQREIFDTLLFVDTLRGEDSTGAFVVSNRGNVEIAKSIEDGPTFLMTQEYRALRNSAFSNGWAMVGHNRKATVGFIEDKNAHPFWDAGNNIVLVHNGSYFGDHKKLKDTEVDSEAIMHTILEEPDIELALRKVDAAYALIWYDVTKKTLHLIRNNARPLYIMETANEYIVSSEEAFLDMVAKRSRLVIKEKPTELKAYELHKFKLNMDHSTDITKTVLDCSFHRPSQTHYSGGLEGAGFVASPPFRRHPYACGYENDPEDESPWAEDPMVVALRNSRSDLTVQYQPLQLEVKPAEHIDTMATNVMNKFYDCVAKTAQTIAYKDYCTIKDDLKAGQKIKVLINDVSEADDLIKSDNFILIGRPFFNHKIYATFHVKEKTFSKLVPATQDALFEIDYDGMTWRRTEPLDSKKQMEEWQGIAVVHGKNPSAIYMQDAANA